MPSSRSKYLLALTVGRDADGEPVLEGWVPGPQHIHTHLNPTGSAANTTLDDPWADRILMTPSTLHSMERRPLATQISSALC